MTAATDTGLVPMRVSKQVRDQEWQASLQAERAYQVLVAHWQQKKAPNIRGTS
jgi:hypothetical protein